MLPGAEVERRFGEDQEVRMIDSKPLAAHLDLPRRLLPRDVEHRLHVRRQARQGLQQQGGLADSRISPDQNDGARNHSAAEDSIEFADASQPAVFTDHFNLRNRGRRWLRQVHGNGAPFPRRGMPFFLDRVPSAAIGTASEPTWRLMPACLAGKDRFGFHESESLMEWNEALS